jgi:hypothetical protein
MWRHFHGLARLTTPTADDAVAVVQEVGLAPERVARGAPALGWCSPFTRREELVAWVRRRLRLPAECEGEIAVVLGARILERDGSVGLPSRPVVMLWWNEAAP